MCSPSGEGCDQAALDGTAVSTLLVGNLTLVSLSHAQQQQQGDPFAPPPPDASQSSLAVLLPIGVGIGCLALALAIFTVWFVARRRRARQQQQQQQPAAADLERGGARYSLDSAPPSLRLPPSRVPVLVLDPDLGSSFGWQLEPQPAEQAACDARSEGPSLSGASSSSSASLSAAAEGGEGAKAAPAAPGGSTPNGAGAPQQPGQHPGRQAEPELEPQLSAELAAALAAAQARSRARAHLGEDEGELWPPRPRARREAPPPPPPPPRRRRPPMYCIEVQALHAEGPLASWQPPGDAAGAAEGAGAAPQLDSDSLPAAAPAAAGAAAT